MGYYESELSTVLLTGIFKELLIETFHDLKKGTRLSRLCMPSSVVPQVQLQVEKLQGVISKIHSKLPV